MISESQERMVAIVEPARWEAVRERVHALGPARSRSSAGSRAEPDIVVLTAPDGSGALDARRPAGRRGPRAGPDPGRRPRVGRDRLPARVARRRPAAALAPAPGAPVEPVDALPLRGQDPGAVLPGAARLAEPLVAALGLRAVRPQRPGEHGRRARSRRGRAPDQGHDQGARRLDRRQRPGRRARPVARRGDVGRRGRPQRGDHRRAAARRHQLPQLRRPDPARGVLAAQRGGPRPVRRLHRARAAGHRRQRLAVQRVARGRRSRRRPRSAIVGLLDDVAKRSVRRSAPRATRCCWSASRAPASRAASTRGSPAPRPRTGRPPLDLARERAPPGVHPRGRRPRPRRELPGRVGRRPRGGGRRDGDLGRASGASAAARPSATRRRSALFGESPSRLVVRGRAAPRAGVHPARPPARAARRRARDHRRPAAGHRARRRGRDGRRRGARQPDRRRPRRRRSTTCATRGTTACHGRSAGRTAGAEGSADVRRRRGRPARSRPRGRGRRRDRAVRAPAPRPGVGRRRGRRTAAT